jgi:hypothetical protein
MINSRNYYLETQGTIKISNRIFKHWFHTKQAILRTRKFVYLIPDLVATINKTLCNSFPGKMIPYEAFYGRFPPAKTTFFLGKTREAGSSSGGRAPSY